MSYTMIWNGKPKFDYKTIKRVDSESGRVYDINNEKLPSRYNNLVCYKV